MASGSGTVSQKGQITLPKDVRDALGLHPGDRLLFDVESGDRAVVRKARPVSPDRYPCNVGTRRGARNGGPAPATGRVGGP
ncbi:MAG: AbrB/MazE/SpoVT family DNA-binding domain-containing protein [Thermoplasmata archaeon]|nr:AbrB/MazE/SpoVT family DNA-binding domain-containing protein [Thermoplasmata archaeon]